MIKSAHVISGCCGFIGFNFTLFLLKKKQLVYGFDNFEFPTRERLKILRKYKNFYFTKFDLSKEIKIPKFLIKNNYKYFFWHLAANSDIRLSSRLKKIDYKNTYLTTKHFFNLSKKLKSNFFFFASSSAVYGDLNKSLVENQIKLNPISNYGKMKLKSERILINDKKVLNKIVFRFPNVIGKFLTHGIIFDFKKKNTRNFYNQLTIIMLVEKDKYINIKLFKNGSIQFTGCKNLEYCNIALNKLLNKLSENIYIYNDSKMNEILFLEDVNKIKISDFKIDMINSNFKLNFEIDRENIYNLIKEKYQCRFEPQIHACVNIKFPIKDDLTGNKVSIFLFQTGSILITGAKNTNHILIAYDFIIDFLINNKSLIKKKDIDDLLTEEEINNIINK